MCRNPITRLSFDTLLIANLFQALFKESFGFNQSTTTCLRSQMVVTAIVHCPVSIIQQIKFIDSLSPQDFSIIVKESDEFLLIYGVQIRFHNQRMKIPLNKPPSPSPSSRSKLFPVSIMLLLLIAKLAALRASFK